MKKLLALLLCLVMLLGIVACGSKEPAPEAAAPEAPVAENEAAQPESGKPVLKVAVQPDPSCTDYDDNDMTRYFEEQIGAEIEWVFLPVNTDDAITKINLWSVDPNADLPDVILGGVFDNTDKDWGASGFLIDWTQYLDKLPNWSSLDEVYHEKTKNEIGTATGEIYSFPQLNANYWNMGYFRWRMNTAWLETLDLEVPTNTEELKQVLLAFRDGDPNGNGLKDEIPLTGNNENNSYGNNTLHALMNCFIYFDSFIRNTGLSLDAETGTTVIAPYATEEWQEGLRYLKELWDEDLISSSYFTHTYETLQAEVNSGDITGALTSGSNGLWADRNSGNNINWNNTKMVPQVKGPSGISYSIHNPNITWRFAGVVNGDNIDLALKFVDSSYTQEAAEWANMGRKGIDWTDDPAALETASNGLIEAGVIDRSEMQYVMSADLWSEPSNIHWWGADPYCYPFHDNALIGYSDPAQWDIYKGWNMAYNRNLYEHEIPTLVYTDEEFEKATEAMINIPDYVKETFAAFITGSMDIDKDWDTYIDTLNGMGLQTLIDVSQAAFERTL